jgi:hypothetical protein
MWATCSGSTPAGLQGVQAALILSDAELGLLRAVAGLTGHAVVSSHAEITEGAPRQRDRDAVLRED